MALASSLDAFADFMLVTRPAGMTSPDTIINMATQYRTMLYPLMLKGLTKKQLFQGGSRIEDYVQLDIVSTHRNYDPTDEFSYTGQNSMTRLAIPWRFTMDHSVMFEHEIDLNQGDEKTVFKRLKAIKDSELETSFCEGEENDLFALPNYETMEKPEKEGTGAALSLRCFITDDGLAPSSTNGGVAGADFSTLMTVDVSTKTNFRNQVETFNNTSEETRLATYVDAMDAMFLDVRFVSPESIEQYAKSTTLQKMRIIQCKTANLMMIKLAKANNLLTNKSDLGYHNGKVTYNGLPLTYISALDAIDTAAGAYRSRFVNFNHFRPIYHTGHLRKRKTKDGGAASPFSTVLIEDTWKNLWCANRREQGIVVAA